MDFFVTHLYFTGCLFLALPFLILFYTRKDTRFSMILVGILCGLTAFFFSPHSVRDYWHPQFIFPTFPFEDFLYGFFFGGFLSEASDLFLHHKLKKTKNRLWILPLCFIVFVILFISIVKYLEFNTIWFLLVFGFFVGLLNLLLNKRLFTFQLLTGFLAIIISYLGFKILIFLDNDFIVNSWKLDNLSGVLVHGIPVEEYLFAFIFGFAVSHLYEIVKGYNIK